MNGSNLIMIFLDTFLIRNIALVYILGMCPFIAISKNLKSASGMSMAIIFVVTLTAGLNWLIYWKILIPFKCEIFTFLIFIITIAATVQFIEMVIDKFFPPLYSTFGIFLPLITVNCIVLAVSLFMVLRNYNFIQTIVYAFGTASGWSLAIILMASIKEKLYLISDIPSGLKGPGITMIIAGILAFAFMGFAGMITIK
ncbi:MAG: NADH:ubiquinone reductase (Na(+)-transporting) subunit E [Candidatus Omnitrophica bacterium]|nr:NADH:ubiquinone reductase (Na(+)-transporting) subunit E [Candidatus Omnitrophota bacterium]